MVKVSVIIPNYNHALFLQQRIQSVLDQSYPDFEVIILDDCSTDESKSVIESYRNHPKISHIIYNASNSGSPFKQWAKGVALAKGVYIWIAESDDVANPSFLNQLVPNLIAQASAALVFCNSAIIDEQNHITGTLNTGPLKYYQKLDQDNCFLIEGVTELKENLIMNCSIGNVSSVLFKSSVLKARINLIKSLKYAGDWLLYILLAAEYDFIYADEIWNQYRSHALNTTKLSSTNYKNALERFQVRLLAFHELNSKNILTDDLKTLLLRAMRIELRLLLGGVWRLKFPLKSYLRLNKEYLAL